MRSPGQGEFYQAWDRSWDILGLVWLKVWEMLQWGHEGLTAQKGEDTQKGENP